MIGIAVVLFVVYAIMMIIYQIGWFKQKKNFIPKNFLPTTKISVIIPARDEEGQIESCLDSILKNNYPKELYEIIVINDFSTDNTFYVAQQKINLQGKVLNLIDFISAEERINAYKKKALSVAINNSSGEIIVSTDADCIVPANWLREIAYIIEHYQAKFIVAPVDFLRKKENLLLYCFQSLDFLTMQGMTAAAATLKMGNMCNGANLAFDKKTFFEVGGYEGIDHIASGDDMLLMDKIEKKYPHDIHYLKSPEAIVKTTVQDSWKGFINQRIRWSSKSDKYDDKKITAVLLFVYLFNLSFLVLFIAGLFEPVFFKTLAVLLVGKVFMELLFIIPVAQFFGKIKELWIFPFLQPLHIIYILVAGFLGKFGTYKWKGRIVQ